MNVNADDHVASKGPNNYLMHRCTLVHTEQTKVSSLHSSMRPSGWGQSVGIPWGDKSLGKNGYIG
ncbi:hypothetical protein Hanom_Chr06g00508241 [Helianthus anomalus]